MDDDYSECRLWRVFRLYVCVCHCCTIRSVYDITVTPKYDKPTSAGSRPVQKVQVMVPGPPDAPQIWTRRSRHHHVDGGVEGGDDEAVIEWSEPRLNGVKVAGYQVYINGKKTGSVLASNHRKAVIPLKGKRSVLLDCGIQSIVIQLRPVGRLCSHGRVLMRRCPNIRSVQGNRPFWGLVRPTGDSGY